MGQHVSISAPCGGSTRHATEPAVLEFSLPERLRDQVCMPAATATVMTSHTEHLSPMLTDMYVRVPFVSLRI